MFSKKAVLFIDILGFRKIVQNCQENPSNIQNIYEVLTIIKTHFSNFTDIQILQFSDSIAISFKANDPGSVIAVIGGIQSLIKRLIIKGYLLRGGLTYGDIYHDSNVIFGPAMINAYDLESTLAIYPRIIIDKEIIEFGRKYLPDFFNENMTNYIFNYVSEDNDEKYYIDYFDKGVETFWEITENEKEFIHSLKQLIENGLKEEDKSVLRKYVWMKDKYNKMTFKLKCNKQLTIGGFEIGSTKEDSFYTTLEQID